MSYDEKIVAAIGKILDYIANPVKSIRMGYTDTVIQPNFEGELILPTASTATNDVIFNHLIAGSDNLNGYEIVLPELPLLADQYKKSLIKVHSPIKDSVNVVELNFQNMYSSDMADFYVRHLTPSGSVVNSFLIVNALGNAYLGDKEDDYFKWVKETRALTIKSELLKISSIASDVVGSPGDLIMGDIVYVKDYTFTESGIVDPVSDDVRIHDGKISVVKNFVQKARMGYDGDAWETPIAPDGKLTIPTADMGGRSLSIANLLPGVDNLKGYNMILPEVINETDDSTVIIYLGGTSQEPNYAFDIMIGENAGAVSNDSVPTALPTISCSRRLETQIHLIMSGAPYGTIQYVSSFENDWLKWVKDTRTLTFKDTVTENLLITSMTITNPNAQYVKDTLVKNYSWYELGVIKPDSQTLTITDGRVETKTIAPNLLLHKLSSATTEYLIYFSGNVTTSLYPLSSGPWYCHSGNILTDTTFTIINVIEGTYHSTYDYTMFSGSPSATYYWFSTTRITTNSWPLNQLFKIGGFFVKKYG